MRLTSQVRMYERVWCWWMSFELRSDLRELYTTDVCKRRVSGSPSKDSYYTVNDSSHERVWRSRLTELSDEIRPSCDGVVWRACDEFAASVCRRGDETKVWGGSSRVWVPSVPLSGVRTVRGCVGAVTFASGSRWPCLDETLSSWRRQSSRCRDPGAPTWSNSSRQCRVNVGLWSVPTQVHVSRTLPDVWTVPTRWSSSRKTLFLHFHF